MCKRILQTCRIALFSHVWTHSSDIVTLHCSVDVIVVKGCQCLSDVNVGYYPTVPSGESAESRCVAVRESTYVLNSAAH